MKQSITYFILLFAVLLLSVISGCSVGTSTVPGAEPSLVTNSPVKKDIDTFAQNADYTLTARIDCSATTSTILQHITTDEYGNNYLGLSNGFTINGCATIPESLCERISEAITDNNEKEALSAMMDDTEISGEDFLNRTGYDLEGEMRNILAVGDRIMAVCVDGDNDGIEDIACEIYWGGSGGFTTFYFFKGIGNGAYLGPYCFESIIEEFGFILFEGKHYLIRTNFDYNTKMIDGLDIFLYADGVLADAVGIRNQITGHTEDITWYDGKLPEPELQEAVNSIDFNQLTLDLQEDDWKPLGTAERDTDDQDYPFASDLDNDGVAEFYSKEIWYPSNMSTIMVGFADFRDESENMLTYILDTINDKVPENNGVYYTFWVNKIDRKPVVYCYFGNHFDFCLYVLTF